MGTCAAFNYLNPKKFIVTSQYWVKALLKQNMVNYQPSPAVLELVREKNIKVATNFDFTEGELSTPTGIALITNLADYFHLPSKYSISSYGVGVGNLKLPFPNLVRVIRINSFEENSLDQKVNPKYEKISVQEAWIDDQSPEDIANFVQQLRNEGAYDVSFHPINMKKDRIGFSIQVILPLDKQDHFRVYGSNIPILLEFVKESVKMDITQKSRRMFNNFG